jgi:hypothetical protein
MALVFIQPPIQRVPDYLSTEIKRPWRGEEHSIPTNAEVKIDGATPPIPYTSA